MQNSKISFTIFNILVVIVIMGACKALSCSNPAKFIDVNMSGKKGSFKTIQGAIDSIPEPNTRWTHIRIAAGTYREQIIINQNKPCIYLEGVEGRSSTIITEKGHRMMNETFTFASLADDVVAKGITFENAFNRPPLLYYRRNVPALAAKIVGDRNTFYNCSFRGVQDTLWDCKGRHYFSHCYIQGGIDFIFGDGQSIYEKSIINFTMGSDDGQGHQGSITAQDRGSNDSPTGFVFKECNITGNGPKTILGRAYGPFSRVIIANSYIDDIIRPEGWGAWNYQAHVGNITYVEEGNKGPGSDKSKRVQWMKRMDKAELKKFLDISYIDKDGWIKKQPDFTL